MTKNTITDDNILDVLASIGHDEKIAFAMAWALLTDEQKKTMARLVVGWAKSV
jgi:hypothetical protein